MMESFGLRCRGGSEVMDGPECLHESALAAARKCRFVPATISGKPVSAWVVIPYEFKLQQ